jgi:putative hydrolase of the HAD superfamily
MIGCIVFDLDDTLILERDYVRSGFSAVGKFVAAEYGIIDFGDRCWSKFETGLRGNIFDSVCREADLAGAPKMIAQLVSTYREHTPEIALLPDASALLARVTPFMKTAVITDGPRASQSRKVKALDLDRLVLPIVLTDELGPGASKPSPVAFELVQQHHGLSADACVYVGDNPHKDFVSPRALGWHTIRVRRPLGLHASLPSGEDVDQEIDDLTQLLPALRAHIRL